MNQAEVHQFAYDSLLSLLSPTCVAAGISLKTMPSDSDISVVRNAMAVLFVRGYSNTAQANSSVMAVRHVGVAKVEAYVIVLAASQVGQRSAVWACELVITALHGKTINGAKVYTPGALFTSVKNGIWQYRIPVDFAVPTCSANSEAQEDTSLANTTW